MKRRIKIRLAMPLALFLLLVSCTDSDLMTVSKALNDTAQGVGVLQTTVIAANHQHLVSDDATSQLLNTTVKINEAGRQAVAITRGINALAPTDRANLLSILRPVIASLMDTQNSVVSKINDQKTQMNVQAVLGLIQASLNTAQIALASRGQ